MPYHGMGEQQAVPRDVQALEPHLLRQLQTHFIDEISTYLRSKGRKISVWNETVTEKGADLQLMKKTGATVYCWVPARRGAEIANELGLPSIYTVYGPYYINRAPSKRGGWPPCPATVPII